MHSAHFGADSLLKLVDTGEMLMSREGACPVGRPTSAKVAPHCLQRKAQSMNVREGLTQQWAEVACSLCFLAPCKRQGQAGVISRFHTQSSSQVLQGVT
jgi:hypothetical protein